MKKEQYRKEINQILNYYSNFKRKNYEKIFSCVYATKTKFKMNTRINNEEIQSELKVILIESLDQFIGTASDDKIIYQFLNYLDKVLYNRLQDRTNKMTLSEEDNNNIYLNNLQNIGVPIEKLDNGYIEKDFVEKLLDELYIQNYYCLFSNREKEVFDLLFYENYSLREVGIELGIKKTTVQNHYERILKKINNSVVRK